MIVLQPVNLSWIKGQADDPTDLDCHGDVDFRIDGDVLVAPSGRTLGMSAAALYLLRTLSTPHSKTMPVGSQLFPCCGFSMWEIPNNDDVVILGCDYGDNFEILHLPNKAGVIVRAPDGREWEVGWSEWRNTVISFADCISDFYAGSSPKKPFDKLEAAGFKRFQSEWERRRGRPLGGITE